MITISRGTNFGPSEYLTKRKQDRLIGGTNIVKRIYFRQGFRIAYLDIYLEFDTLSSSLCGSLIQDGIELNTSSEDENVPKVEINKRTTKNRVRSIWNSLPFKNIPA